MFECIFINTFTVVHHVLETEFVKILKEAKMWAGASEGNRWKPEIEVLPKADGEGRM